MPIAPGSRRVTLSTLHLTAILQNHTLPIEDAMSRAHARLNNFHGTKRQLVGHQVQPAWKPNAAANKAAQQAEASGSKILLSRLPMDVSEKEVEVRSTRRLGGFSL